ncbi:M48 family metallopeptidase [Streptomyces turgidiscabies]|uniref:Zn-dependent protease with chaperone function n=1 Tax=Streptomyces turgidiscabies TaxID=85558 RepID=A0ABU0RJU3_9ACTN|nr:M48 family metallopeptidase [Streptomyces turgidiscabies]MDQ0932258.1 Zn-dependent protease with chaperone function [Streptomyces turgidiscabies]
MGSTLRALRALVLLAGFHLLGVLLLAALVGTDYLLFANAPLGSATELTAVATVLAVPLVRGLFMLRTPRGEEPPGLPVTEADEPELWRTVRELADQVGTRAPSSILLTGDVNAAVSEDAHLLGLLPGPRRLHLGVPLIQGLTEAQLRAVLAHELGHYAHSDTRLAAVTRRGRVQLQRTIRNFEKRAGNVGVRERSRQERRNAKSEARGKEGREIGTEGVGVTYRTLARIYTAYAELYLRATLADSRRQEYAADASAARIAGRDSTASALREIPVLAGVFGFYVRSYATLGTDAALLPPRGEVFGGFSRMLTARQLELACLRSELPTDPTSPYDSHPPVADRVRRVEQLPADDRADEAPGAAIALLTDEEGTFRALEDAVLTYEVRQLPRAADWQELLNGAMAANLAALDTPLHRALALYTKRRPTLPALLALIDDGQLWELARRLPLSDEAVAATGRAFREFVRPTLHNSLHSMVMAKFSARSRMRWSFSWEQPAKARLLPAPGSAPDDGAPGLDAAIGAAVDRALADHPDTAPLRALLPPAPHSPRETDAPR